MGSLGKALKLFDNEIRRNDQLLDPFTSQDCSIDSCIHHTENDSNLVELLDKKNIRRNVTMMDVNNDDDDKLKNTLYRRPIRIPKRVIREGLNMGSTLFIIVTFNLALAHHLKAIKNNSSLSLLLLNGTVELYNLANNWQQKQQQQQQHSQISSNYVTDDDSDYDDEDDMILSMDDDKDTNSCSSSSTSSYYSVRFNTVLYNNLNHLKQLLFAMNINNNRNFDTSSTERHLDDLISSVRTHIVTCDDYEESTNMNFMEEEEGDDDLEFEYYNE